MAARFARWKPEGGVLLLQSCETHTWRGGEDNRILDSSQWRDLPQGKDFGQPFRVITAVSGRRLIPFTKHCQLMDMSGYGLAVQQRCSKLGHSIQAAGIHWNWIYIRVRSTHDRNEKSLGLFATGKQGSARCKYMYLAEFQERNTVNCETEFRPWFTEVVAGFRLFLKCSCSNYKCLSALKSEPGLSTDRQWWKESKFDDFVWRCVCGTVRYGIRIYEIQTRCVYIYKSYAYPRSK